jgi:hypothetical protein
MIQLMFHKELYLGEAVDEAVKVYSDYAKFEMLEQPHVWMVSLRANDPEQEVMLASELANYALGRTIEGTNQAQSPPPEGNAL